MKVCVDWDATLVDDNQEWLEGAVDSLVRMLGWKWELTIQSCRAEWPEGKQQIVDKLREERLHHVSVTDRKPYADVYVDDKGVTFTNWADVLEVLIDRNRSL